MQFTPDAAAPNVAHFDIASGHELNSGGIPPNIHTLIVEDSSSGGQPMLPTIRELPATIKHVIVSDSCRNVGGIDSNFIRTCDGVESITFPSTFPRCRLLGEGFVTGNKNLKALDLSNRFPSVLKIGANFLFYNLGLADLNLSGAFPAATKTEGSFCSSCPALVTLDLTRALLKLRDVGYGFISDSRKLRSVNLSLCLGAKRTVIGNVYHSTEKFLGNLPAECEVCFASAEDETFVIDRLGRFERGLTRTSGQDKSTSIVHTKYRSSFAPVRWSWRSHKECPAHVRTAVLALHQGVSFTDHKDECRFFPAEVAYQICRFIPF